MLINQINQKKYIKINAKISCYYFALKVNLMIINKNYFKDYQKNNIAEKSKDNIIIFLTI